MTVAFAHKAGCPVEKDISSIIDQVGEATEESLGWLSENEWALGIIYVFAGPLFALFGAAWFPYIVSAIVAIFTAGIVVMVSMTAGWTTGTLGTIITLCVACVAGLLVGYFIRENVSLLLGLLGLATGFYAGLIVFTIITGVSGEELIWAFWVISVVFAILGCLITVYLGIKVVMVSTSLVGSYLFMRSWTFFFPNQYPSLAEMVEFSSDDFKNLDAQFWVFIGVFVFSFVGSLIFQCKYGR